MICKNTCEVFKNDVMEEEYEINPGLQTESSQNLENEKKTMKENIRKLQVERTMWKSNSINLLRRVFLCVNDNKDVDVKCQQTMRCILCYNSPILFCNLKTQVRKSLIIYNTTNGITTLKKHVNTNDSIIAKMFEEEINNLMRGEVEKQLAKKIQIHLTMQLLIFLLPKNLSKRTICNRKCLLKVHA